MRYRLDPAVEVLDGGRALLGGDPTRLLRLSGAGARLVDRWRDRSLEPATPAERTLVDRLVAASMAHPDVERSESGRGAVLPDAADLDRIAVVVPVKDRAARLGVCLAALVGSGARHIVVVDDGSADAASHRDVAAEHGALLVRREHSGGPAAARMAGWRSLDAPDLVAFVDSDVVVDRSWLPALLEHLADPRVGLVAPRVMHPAGAGAGLVDRYEAANSPLDLGPDPAPIVAGTRVAYVPAAAMLVRAEAFDAVGGFDETLDVGEDVDLLWRLADAGWRCRYEPASVVAHAGRSELGSVLRRRYDYGRSAAPLDERHPGALPPVRGSRWSAAVVTLAVVGHPFAAAGLAGWTVGAMARKLVDVPDAALLAARLVLRGHLGFARQVARASVRPWLPVTLVVSLVSRRARRLALLAAVVHPLLSRRARRPDVPLPTWVALTLADDAAYSAGVWAGCIRAGRFGPLAPR